MNWNQFKQYYLELNSLGFAIDTSTVGFPEHYLKDHASLMQRAFDEMDALERGAIANPDEQRMVGHYWLRDADKAPSDALKKQIKAALSQVDAFAKKIHSGSLTGEHRPFSQLLTIGIGGSALGPQFLAHALGKDAQDKLTPYFLDNTDPDGIDRTLKRLEPKLDETLVIVISKSGSTPETRNGMLETKAFFESKGLNFSSHAVAVTGEGSQLDRFAQENNWLERFPMWDWVGGRTSLFCAVGLLPAALQGISIFELLQGAAAMDEATRSQDIKSNPAALLALSWYYLTEGKGRKDMVILPYKDRLELFSRYLQQLVMESLGKSHDKEGRRVEQGISVYGNKGSTDQHAYVQQLRDGVSNFFAVFIRVLKNRDRLSIDVDQDVTSGDFLNGFFLGTRKALLEKGRASISLAIDDVSPRSIGQLIALFERAVGLYASMLNINAYHQPGVEAGKKAAAHALDLKRKLLRHLKDNTQQSYSVEELAQAVQAPEEATSTYWILEAMLGDGVVQKKSAEPFYHARYQIRT